MTPVERIKALRLSDEEIKATHGFSDGSWAMHDSNIADAQFDKLLRGLAEIVPQWLSEQKSEGLNDDPYIPEKVYDDFEMMLRQALEEVVTTEPADSPPLSG